MIRTPIAHALLALVLSGTTALADEIVVRNDSIPPGEPVDGLYYFDNDTHLLSRAGVRVGSQLTVPVSGTIVGVQIPWASDQGGAAPSQQVAIRITENGPYPYSIPGPTLAEIDSPTLIDGATNEFRYLDPGTNLDPISIPVTAGAQYFVDLEFGHHADHDASSPPPDLSQVPSILADADLLSPNSHSFMYLPGYSEPGAFFEAPLVLPSTGAFAIRLIIVPVPEPSSLALIGFSAIGMAAFARRPRKRRAN